MKELLEPEIEELSENAVFTGRKKTKSAITCPICKQETTVTKITQFTGLNYLTSKMFGSNEGRRTWLEFLAAGSCISEEICI